MNYFVYYFKYCIYWFRCVILREKYWGYHIRLNLADCDPKKIRSKKATKDYIHNILKIIKMTPYKNPTVIHFGRDPEVTGISFNQFLEESNCCGHLVEIDNSAYIDIFSCKFYEIKRAISYTQYFYDAKRVNWSFSFRKA